MKKLLFAVTVFLTVSGCNPCYNVECDAPDADRIDGLTFEFGDTYSDSELASAFVLLYSKGNLSHPIEAYTYAEDLKESGERVIMIQRGYPFATVDNLANFDFIISTDDGQTTHQITEINTKGFYPTDCCCCYRNTDKFLTVDGVSFDRSGNEVAVILNR
jgi:hypothetical protein